MVCFFAHGIDAATLERVEFYRQDIEILRDLGLDVRIATRWAEVVDNANLYFVWWWTWAFQPLSKALIRKRPVVITGTFDLCWGTDTGDYYARPPWERFLLRWAAKAADANVLVSDVETQGLSREFRLNNCHYIPHIVDTDLYQERRGPRENFILTVAWLHGPNARRKCIPEVIQAAAIVKRTHPHVRFVIAGEKKSGYKDALKLARDLCVDDIVEFPGVITRAEKINLMQRCKLYLQPSRYEGFGLAILEAMSCGAAVVSSPVGAVPEVIGNAGGLVEGTSPEVIAQEICTLLSDDHQREAIGREARKRAEQLFPFDRRRRELGEIVNGLLNRKVN
jgi:glycosyltransferase involved in cell wall biosynthesis